MNKYQYLSPEWAEEAKLKLREQISPEIMKYLSSSILTVYQNCPDGKEKALYYQIVDGVFQDISIQEGDLSEAEFVITGDYETFAQISRSETKSSKALMNGNLRLKGNMIKALSLVSIVEQINHVLSEIPCKY